MRKNISSDNRSVIHILARLVKTKVLHDASPLTPYPLKELVHNVPPDAGFQKGRRIQQQVLHTRVCASPYSLVGSLSKYVPHLHKKSSVSKPLTHPNEKNEYTI